MQTRISKTFSLRLFNKWTKNMNMNHRLNQDIEMVLESQNSDQSTINQNNLYKVITRCINTRNIEHANNVFKYFNTNGMIVDDLSISYLVEGNLEENRLNCAFGYLVYAELTNQVLDQEILQYCIHEFRKQDISYIKVIFDIIKTHFTTHPRLIKQLIKIAQTKRDIQFISSLQEYSKQQGLDLKQFNINMNRSDQQIRSNQQNRIDYDISDKEMSEDDDQIEIEVDPERESELIQTINTLIIKQANQIEGSGITIPLLVSVDSNKEYQPSDSEQ